MKATPATPQSTNFTTNDCQVYNGFRRWNSICLWVIYSPSSLWSFAGNGQVFDERWTIIVHGCHVAICKAYSDISDKIYWDTWVSQRNWLYTYTSGDSIKIKFIEIDFCNLIGREASYSFFFTRSSGDSLKYYLLKLPSNKICIGSLSFESFRILPVHSGWPRHYLRSLDLKILSSTPPLHELQYSIQSTVIVKTVVVCWLFIDLLALIYCSLTTVHSWCTLCRSNV